MMKYFKSTNQNTDRGKTRTVVCITLYISVIHIEYMLLRNRFSYFFTDIKCMQ